MNPPQIIALWSAPRSRSTAFLRMMMEHPEVVTLHEPFSHVTDFGKTVVDGREIHTEVDLIAAIKSLARRTRVFFKDTTDFAYPGVLADQDFLRRTAHTIIIRHPSEVIASHYALNPAVELEDIGIRRLHELYTAVVEAGGPEPVVIDSADLLDHPEATVRAYCQRVGLAFTPRILHWEPGTRAEWGVAARWHVDVTRTSGFQRSERRYEHTVHNHPTLASYFDYHLPYYERLRAARLTPAA